jgi:hypothetical protein
VRKPQPIRAEEWLAELLRIQSSSNAEGFARTDVERILNLHENAAGVRLRQWCKSGIVEFAGRRLSSTIDGRPRYYPVYRITRKLHKAKP